jgi:hypothetical protein
MSKQLKMMRVLINRYHGGKHPAVSALGEEEAEALSEMKVDSEDANIAIRQPWEVLLSIHYTWYYEPLKQIPEAALAYVVASLPDKQRKKVAAHFNLKELPAKLAPPVKHLLLDRLYSLLEVKKKVPLPFIPKQPLHEILGLTKESLVDLIECLGVYDVAEELKQVVDRNRLSKIIDALSARQQGFLKKVIHKRSKWSAGKLGIDQWGGNKQKLRKALQLRGMMRLGKALKGHDENFVSHFLLKLDTGRARQMEKYLDREESDSTTQSLVMDVKEGISYIRDHE